jgi:hypothetical protein
MATRQKGRRDDALKGRELRIHLEERSSAPAEAVYDLLADLRSHLEWAGTRQPKESYRLLTMETPEGPASVGTEFSSTGADPMGRFADSSVVTEASRPGLFEFVTEARLTTKKDELVQWTNIHRYQLAPEAGGCRISYTLRVVRISDLPGEMAMFKVPGIRFLMLKISGSFARRGLRNLVRLAEERAGAR